jgi:hypothetical protein
VEDRQTLKPEEAGAPHAHTGLLPGTPHTRDHAGGCGAPLWPRSG